MSSTVENQAAARLLPRNARLYSAATTGSASAEIANSAIIGGDGKRVGDGEMVSIQFTTRTHWKAIDASGEDAADTGDPYYEAGEIQDGFLTGLYGIVIYPTANGQINIWESSRSKG